MRKKVLIIGASGHLGRHLFTDLQSSFAVVGTYKDNREHQCVYLDISDPIQVGRVIEREDPNVIIIAAAVSNVAFCESHPDKSLQVNVEGVRNVARHSHGRTLVFFSSDAVFNGSRKEFFESDTPNPLSVYGKHKLEGENIVSSFSSHLVLRSARFYSRDKGNHKFINYVIEALSNGNPITAPIDTPGNPTFVEDLSRATATLLARERTGTYHVAGPRAYSLYETTLIVAEVFGFDKRLIRAVERDYDSPVPRISSVLNSSKLKRERITLCDLKEGLRKIKDAI